MFTREFPGNTYWLVSSQAATWRRGEFLESGLLPFPFRIVLLFKSVLYDNWSQYSYREALLNVMGLYSHLVHPGIVPRGYFSWLEGHLA